MKRELYTEIGFKKIKQRNSNFIKYILVEQFIWTNKRGETKHYFHPIGRNIIVHQENNNILDEIVVSFFHCF